MLLAKKLLAFQNYYPKVFSTPGTHVALLTPGIYDIVLAGAGGAGGTRG